MVRHIVMWTFLDEVPLEKRSEKGLELKKAIEALKDMIPGVQHLKVEIVPVGTSKHLLACRTEYKGMPTLAVRQAEYIECYRCYTHIRCPGTCVRDTETDICGCEAFLL